jgi:hypothetical protein
VTLLTAHKILISSAIIMFMVYAAREYQQFADGDVDSLIRGILAAAVAAGLAFYLRWVWIHRPGAR